MRGRSGDALYTYRLEDDFDGETVSLHPSIGNWSLAQISLRLGRVNQSRQVVWTDEQVIVEHRRDRAAKARHYGTASSGNGLANHSGLSQVDNFPGGFWRRLWYWVKPVNWYNDDTLLKNIHYFWILNKKIESHEQLNINEISTQVNTMSNNSALFTLQIFTR